VAGQSRSSELRAGLVRRLEAGGWIRSPRVREAFLATPRELFLPEFAAREGLGAVYRDEAIVTKRARHGMPLSSSSQPAIMALMLEALEPADGMRVLEIGAGTGYNAALLAHLVGATAASSRSTSTRSSRAARGGRCAPPAADDRAALRRRRHHS
jgi:protein-L-isoaspartate(D-aspartate) O-methyltransferase